MTSQGMDLTPSRGVEGLEGLSLRRAIYPRELASAQCFRHQMLIREGFLPEGSEIRTVGPVEWQEATFVICRRAKIVACQSVVTDSPDDVLTRQDPFGLEVVSLRRSGLRIGQLVAPAVEPGEHSRRIRTELLLTSLSHCLMLACDEAVMPVDQFQAPEFTSMGFERFGPVRVLDPAIPFPAVLLRLNLSGVLEADSPSLAPVLRTLAQRGGYLQSVELWARQAQEMAGRWADGRRTCEAQADARVAQ